MSRRSGDDVDRERIDARRMRQVASMTRRRCACDVHRNIDSDDDGDDDDDRATTTTTTRLVRRCDDDDDANEGSDGSHAIAATTSISPVTMRPASMMNCRDDDCNDDADDDVDDDGGPATPTPGANDANTDISMSMNVRRKANQPCPSYTVHALRPERNKA